MTTGNQSIPNLTATLLTLPTRETTRYLLVRNSTASAMYIGTTNTITNSSANACILPAGKDHVFTVSPGTTVYIYQNSGGALRIDWLLQV